MKFYYLVCTTISMMSFSIFAQNGDIQELSKKSILNLPVGTVMTLDGKSLSQIQSNCPNKSKKKMLIKGEEVEIETAGLLFQDGSVKCHGGIDLSLIVSDLSGRYVSLKGNVPNKEPLQCKVKEVTEVKESIGIYLSSPCNSALFFNRAAFDFRAAKDLTIESFEYNLGEHIKFSLDYDHNSPLRVNSNNSSKENSKESTSKIAVEAGKVIKD